MRKIALPDILVWIIDEQVRALLRNPELREAFYFCCENFREARHDLD